MSATPQYDQAVEIARGVLSNVKADQMGDPTPCKSWAVKDLINHLVGAQDFFLSALEDRPPAAEGGEVGDDYVAAFDALTAKVTAGFAEEGVLQKTLTLPFGQMPGFAVAGLAATDTFTHAWDLAKATGQDTDLAPDLAEALLQGARMSIQPGFRGEEPMPFGAEQAAPDGASSADQLAAFLGRTV
jgi:uncharacterized protein (TIGR03086 family)